ncbi:MAG: hypothetical protein HQ557_19885 [Bacteroidetes bacterium]|nr:hypothetical protein [Bacteroidota bacterium]
MGEQIVLGLGNNIDYEIVWDSTIFSSLVDRFSIDSSEITTGAPIASVRDLLISILGFMSRGVGGERYVESLEIIEDFSRVFNKKITIGGTSVRAAIAMRKLGYTSALHLVTNNPNVRKLIPQDSPYVCSNELESTYPHLIIQFTKGISITVNDAVITTTHANRIIYNTDYDNKMMKLSTEYASMISDARLFLISGFNAMQDPTLLKERLNSLQSIMKSLPARAVVLYEDACFHNPILSLQVRKALISVINVYSLNEDEMQEYLGDSINLLDPNAVMHALKKLHKLLPVPILIIHTKYWALAFGKDANRYAPAIEGGITMATTRFRFGDNFNAYNYYQTSKGPVETRGYKFSKKIEEIGDGTVCCRPSFIVNEKNVTTIGLGDAFVGGLIPALVQI